MVGARVNGKVKDDGVADMVNVSGVAGNVSCVRGFDRGNVDRVSSGVKDVGVDGKLKCCDLHSGMMSKSRKMSESDSGTLAKAA